MRLNINHKAFLSLLKAGLLPVHGEGGMVNGPFSEDVDWGEVYRLAEEQSVIGLIASGIEAVQGSRFRVQGSSLVPQTVVLQFVDQTLQTEQRNKGMNEFVVKLMKRLRDAGVRALVVKGQGVAQCYDKPLWRSSGDVDLLLDRENYEKAKANLIPVAYDVQPENRTTMHQAMSIMGYEVELHGMMPFSVSKRAQRVNDEVVRGSLSMVNGDFGDGAIIWESGDVGVYLPNPDNHLFLVFTHFLHHFFIEGVGLRQICDWCRMLWTYRDSLNHGLLESRLREAGLMTEWKTFAALAVDSLGMPVEAMPLYDLRFKVQGSRILKLVLETGNFGHNKDLSYRTRYKGVTYKMVSLWRRVWDFVRFVPIFPLDAPRFFFTYVFGKVKG